MNECKNNFDGESAACKCCGGAVECHEATPRGHIGKGGLTGKVDIDGIQIKDGDFMEYATDRYYHPKPYLVEWDDDDAGFSCENADNFMSARAWHEMRIVGNRVDNPELVEACK